MTLWAVRAWSSDGEIEIVYPAESEGEAHASAGRINEFVTYMAETHPDSPVDLQASAIAWKWDPADHALVLAEMGRAESELGD